MPRRVSPFAPLAALAALAACAASYGLGFEDGKTKVRPTPHACLAPCVVRFAPTVAEDNYHADYVGATASPNGVPVLIVTVNPKGR